MNIILFGAPGAGKGTQSTLLVERKKMKQISTGDLFRDAIKNKTELGLKAKTYMDRGELVPDDITIGMVEEVLKTGTKDFILDGFPRTVAQATALNALLERLKMSIGKAIFLEVPYAILLNRLTGRWICRTCGTVYHATNKPPQKSGFCDKCGGELYQRADDKVEVIENRLKAYEEFTRPLKDFYRGLDKYFEVNGSKETEQVYGEISTLLN